MGLFELQPASFDVREMIWSPSEYEQYNKLIEDASGDKEGR